MCGINGIAGFEDKELIKRMNDAVAHRGPDDSGFFSDRNVCLGHRRLSIIDLSKRGHQPMCNENKDIWIVFNGEIYNFRELKKELDEKGHRFSSDSDTEAIIHLYEEEGIGCVRRLKGIFAFAIYDSKKKIVFIARDQLGVKPLHYAFVDNGSNMLFASEIKSILQCENVRREVNLNGLHKFMNFNYIFGGETLFRGIFKLNPGHCLVYDIKTKKHRIGKYWELKIEKTDHPEDYYVGRIREGLSESIRMQLVSDVPLGVFLSGGIDSSSIVALMSEFDDIEKPIKTYAVGFNEPWDELHDAKRVSDKFGTDHHEIYVESDVLKHYPEFIWHMDTPKTNISPQFYISKLAKRSVTVALTGLGGDELFAGYRRHKYYYHQEKISAMIPESLGKPFFSAMSRIALSNYLKRGMIYLANIHDEEKTYTIAAPLLVYEDERDDLYGEGMKKAGLQDFKDMLKPYLSQKTKNDDADYYNQTLKMEIKTYLNDDLLERMDRMSMAHAVEARVPFLDHDFVEFAFSIPNKYRRFKLGTTSGKDLLCKAMKGKVPDFVFKKKKVGFNMSPYYWFKAHLREHIKNILTKEAVYRRGLFSYKYVERFLNKKPSENLYYQYQTLWNMMAFEIWHQMYIDADRKRIMKPKMGIEDYS
ncbi:asparagine synthase (glutamine-hydrolyzing) [Candidatus Woesearchaeota archaeon CG10_big_fil_rev_8_21_14_0_10_44_13]|nr:MAG: asparagine synthase (glutamine-hydrolyzing) [Candidatus Woesearchaeota archaeon CG10_big_fil_rev_8_21_14_0_10_44_13]